MEHDCVVLIGYEDLQALEETLDILRGGASILPSRKGDTYSGPCLAGKVSPSSAEILRRADPGAECISGRTTTAGCPVDRP